jgi:SNF2 family DNA or RNA helicase
VLIGHPGSGGIGVNLTASSVSIFYSRGFSLEHDIQAEARNYRGGSERHDKITRIDLVAPGTIDEEVVRKLHAKQTISDVILKGMLDGGGVPGEA